MSIMRDVLLPVIFFFIAIAVVARFHEETILVLLVLGVGAAVSISLWHSRRELLSSGIAAIVGPIGEIACVRAGVWGYSGPTVFGIPPWLPIMWGLAVLMFVHIADSIPESRGNP